MMIASITLKPGGGRRGFTRSLLSLLLLLLLSLGLSRSNSDDFIAQRQYVFVKLESIGDVRPAEASVDNIILTINKDSENNNNALSDQASTFTYEEHDIAWTDDIKWKDGRAPDWSIFHNADSGGTTFMKPDGTLRPLDSSRSSYADIYGDREGIWIQTEASFTPDTIQALKLSVSLKFGRGNEDLRRYYKMQVGVGSKQDDYNSFQVLAEVVAAPTATQPGNADDWELYTAEWDASTAVEGSTSSDDKCTIPAAATTFIITGPTIRADTGETPEWFELAEIKLFTADGTNVAPDARYEFLVAPLNPQDKDVMTDGEIFDETAGKFVVWGGSEEDEEQEHLVYTFRGEDLVQITFESPVELAGVELYSTNYESFGTDCLVASVETGPLPLRIVYDAHPNQNRAYAHCLENGFEFAVGTNCSTREGADPPFRKCAQIPIINVAKENTATDSNTVFVDTAAIIDGDDTATDTDIATAVVVTAANTTTYTTYTTADLESSSSSLSSSSFSTYSVAIVAASVVGIIMTTTTITMMTF